MFAVHHLGSASLNSSLVLSRANACNKQLVVFLNFFGYKFFYGVTQSFQLFLNTTNPKTKYLHRVAEVAREHGWHPPKSLDSDENFKPEHTLFCRKLRFVAIYALLGDLWTKEVLFGSKTVFLGQEVH